MSDIRPILRRIREGCSFSLEDVSEGLKPEISISGDYLSKVERYTRPLTPQLIEGLSKVYELPTLLDYYYELELRNLLEEHPNPKKLLRKVLKEWDEPVEFNETSPKSKWGLNGLKDPSKYKHGGKNGKVKGYDFYLREDGTLQPKHRKILLDECQNWMMNVPSSRIDKPNLENGELDRTHTDLEIVDSWNEFYDKYGFHFPKFKRKWEREFLPSKEEEGIQNRKSKKKPTQSEVEPQKIKISDILKRFHKPNTDGSDLG